MSLLQVPAMLGELGMWPRERVATVRNVQQVACCELRAQKGTRVVCLAYRDANFIISDAEATFAMSLKKGLNKPKLLKESSLIFGVSASFFTEQKVMERICAFSPFI